MRPATVPAALGGALLLVIGLAVPVGATQRRAPSQVSPTSTGSSPLTTAAPTAAPPTTGGSPATAASPARSGPAPAPEQPPPTIPADPNNLAQQASEVSPAEAQLVGLLDGVRARLANLTVQLQALDKDTADNQAALDQANQDLAARQAAVAAADQHVQDLAAAIAVARDELRSRAVAAYVLPPADQVATMIVHLQSLSQLSDIRGYYDAVVDTQIKAVKHLDKLRHDAISAARQAAAARDLAKRQQESVSAQQARLNAIRATFVQVQQESHDQETQQTALLSQANAQKAAFEEAVQQQQQLSNQIEALLRNLQSDGGPALPAASGFFDLPIQKVPITSPFGPRLDPLTGLIGFHPGIDFGATFGTPIHAAGDGTVIWAGPDGGYGNLVIIDHGHSMATAYAHQSLVLVHVGDQVTRGQVLGEVGSTGFSTGPHLHFEVRINGTPVDPVPYL